MRGPSIYLYHYMEEKLRQSWNAVPNIKDAHPGLSLTLVSSPVLSHPNP